METQLAPLPDYRQLPPTTSCYLDGRYFNLAFQDYPGLIESPLVISIRRKSVLKEHGTVQEETYRVRMESSEIDQTVTGLLRLIIETPESRHSNLLILDYQNKKAYRFEPLGVNAPYFEMVNQIIKEYLGMFMDFDLEIIDVDLDLMNETNPECELSGYCVAYIILFAYSMLSKQPFDPSEIRKFSTLVEQTYGKLPEKGADIEMGLFDPNRPPNTGGALVGGLAGGTLGGLAFGGPGLLLGGLGGAALGSTF